MRKLFSFFVVAVSFLFSIAAFAQSEPEVKGMVEKAAKLLSEKGDEALAVIGKKDGEFHKGELYAFIYDENVKMLAHPEKPELVGQSFKGKPDMKGKKFRDEIVEKALAGGGWTEYSYQKPGATGIHKKKVLSRLAKFKDKKFIVAVGMYAE